MTYHLHINFLSGRLLYRLQHATLRNELLARAIGISPRKKPGIIDATAGLGRDSLLLAALGYHVTLLERSPILHEKLKTAMAEASQHPALSEAIQRMELISADAIDWLPRHSPVDVIYLDPMFPERQKSASVRKEMAILQELLGTDPDSEQLLEVALTCATRRVVVKRPRLAETIGGKAPHFNLVGKSSRFDIYLT